MSHIKVCGVVLRVLFNLFEVLNKRCQLDLCIRLAGCSIIVSVLLDWHDGSRRWDSRAFSGLEVIYAAIQGFNNASGETCKAEDF